MDVPVAVPMFFCDPDRISTSLALFDGRLQRWWTFGELRDRVQEVARHLESPQKALVFCFCRNEAGTVLTYLAALEAGHAVALLDEELDDEFKQRLIRLYQPDFVAGPKKLTASEGFSEDYLPLGPQETGNSIRLWRCCHPVGSPIHADLALLLSTSGTTGSPKFVRLSKDNLLSNARSICQVLDINAAERPISSLPLHYSYGLSVINSHLVAGAPVILTEEGILSSPFWESFRQCECTSFAGTPYSYQLLDRLGLRSLKLSSLDTMTQAGGKLSTELIRVFQRHMERRGGRFFVMYGQTEATARISVLPFQLLEEKLGSVGFALPGGHLTIHGPNGEVFQEPFQEGQVVYEGPNVMMGYACGRDDLSLGDMLKSRLRTGDIGYLDEQRALFITGRLKRISKLFGLRVNLDDVESLLVRYGTAAVVGSGDKLIVYCEFEDQGTFRQCRRHLSAKLKVNHRAFEFRRVQQLPLTPNGKIDYSQLSDAS